MEFQSLFLPGCFLIKPELRCDERGFFARTWCEREARDHGITAPMVQCSISFNIRRGTLRGMHFQDRPFQEGKLVRCTSGSIYDVILDLRQGPTYCRWKAVELTSENRLAIYIPPGVAHGFVTLEEDSEVFYEISEFYHAEAAKGVRWNDPAFRIEWPIADPIVSERDGTYPDFKP